MQLYKIAPAIAEIANNDELTIEQKLEQINSLELILTDKIDNICAYVYEQNKHLESIKNAIKEQQEALKQAQAKNDSLETYALEIMQLNHITEIKSKFFAKLKIINNGGAIPVIINDVDIETIPQEFVKITKDFNKTEIKDALEAGEVLEWAKFGERKQRITYK